MTPSHHDRVEGWSPIGTPLPSAAEPATVPGTYPAHAGAVRLSGPRFQHNPAQVYREMRRQHGPVAPVLLDGDLPAWLVLGYRELHYVTSNPELYGRDSRRWNAWDRVPPDWPLLPVVGYQPTIMHAEGAEFERRSTVIHDVLGAVDHFELRALCERISDELIDGFAGRGEADLIAEYASKLPVHLMTLSIGVPEAELPRLLQQMNAITDGGPDALAAHAQYRATLQRALDDKRAHPGSDIPSGLVNHPASLTDEEAIYDLMMILGIGQQPTTDWIGNTLRLMLTDSRFAVTLSGGRRSVGQALNEVLWEDTPMQNMAGRWAVRSTQLAGQRIQAGDLLILSYAAANTDPQVRPDPYAGSDGNHAHMSFSHGEHRCPFPAQEIAEVIAKAGVEVLLDRLPDVSLAVAPDALVWRASAWLRGLTALPVTFTPS